MSSILKALKKIEVQSSNSESFFNMPEATDPNRENDSKVRRRRLTRRLIALALIVLVVFIAIYVFLNRPGVMITKIFRGEKAGETGKNSGSPSANSKIFRAKVPPAPPSRSPGTRAENRLAKKPVKSTPPSRKDKTITADRVAPTPKAAVDQQKIKTPSAAGNTEPAKTATLERPLRKESPPGKAAAPRKSAAAKSVPSGKPASKAKKPVQTRTYDRMDDSKLKLQALAWFNDPPKRMAVINSRIVREGGSVDGYQVTEIRRQDVVVSDGRKSWRLEFGLKQ